MQTISTAWGASGLQCSNPGCASKVALYCTRRCYTDCTIYKLLFKLNLEFKNSWFWEWICEPTRKIRHKHIWFWRIQSSLWAKGLIFRFPPWFAMFYRNWRGLRHEAWRNNFWFMCTTSLNPRNHIWCKYLIVRSFKKRTMFAICAISVKKHGCGARNFVHIQENLVYSWRFWLQVVMISHFRGHVVRDS